MKTLILLIFCTFLLIVGCETTPVNSVVQQSQNSDCYLVLVNNDRYEMKIKDFYINKQLLFIDRIDSADISFPVLDIGLMIKDSTLCQ